MSKVEARAYLDLRLVIGAQEGGFNQRKYLGKSRSVVMNVEVTDRVTG